MGSGSLLSWIDAVPWPGHPMLLLSLACCGCAAIPAVLTVWNLREYSPPLKSPEPPAPSVTVCIPARNEAAGIAECVRSVLQSGPVLKDVLVIDDHSTDRTAVIVRGLAEEDGRVLLLQAPALPAGWNGKQHACWIAAQHALGPEGRHPRASNDGRLLCFLDADVRLEAGALERTANVLTRSGAALVSGFPLEETGTPLEWLLLPLIHFVLLGFLPLAMLRRTRLPGFAAGCGQFLLVDGAAYRQSGGHAAIRHTMHDGLLLPRLLRRSGYSTRLVDLTALARCRMYRSGAATWQGLAKNATEGMAATGSIVPFTLLLGLGQVLPLPLLLLVLAQEAALPPSVLLFSWAAVVLSFLPRLLEVRRFRQRAISAVLHPVGVALLLLLQWYAFGRKLLRRPAAWKDREYQAA